MLLTTANIAIVVSISGVRLDAIQHLFGKISSFSCGFNRCSREAMEMPPACLIKCSNSISLNILACVLILNGCSPVDLTIEVVVQTSTEPKQSV